MVEQTVRPPVQFSGTKREQDFAAGILQLMLARGMFMSSNAPIRVPVAVLASYLEQQGQTDAVTRVLKAAEANSGIFATELVDGQQYLSTTRVGRAPARVSVETGHTFAARFISPLPKLDRPATPRAKPRLLEPVVDVLAGMEIAAVPVPPVVPEVAVEPAVVDDEPLAVTRTITTQSTRQADVTEVDDVDLALALRERLGSDPRIANFGEQWLMEDRVPRFSRGDLRRLRDYMQEKEQPLTDEDLVQDVLAIRPGSPDFELMRFALNYRLSNEHREFEFVGTGNQRFWSTSGLPQIGTTRRKLNEIGSDYRFLLDEESSAPAFRSRESIDRTLTFYEFIHGLLPYDAEMQELLPAPLIAGQKSAVLTFECPQSFTTYLVELRFPTPNRGGFFLGLDDFYAENLVPGAIISIQRTDNDGHYRVEYIAEAAQSDQLLELDERRAVRYVFRPTTYACGVDEALLLTESRFGRLANEKPMDDKVRRRPEAVIAATFERIGDERDANFSAAFDTLLAGVNIERPVSASQLRSILDHDDTGAFSRDPDVPDSYTYVPGTSP